MEGGDNLKQKYHECSKISRRAVAKAKFEATKEWYDELDTHEGQDKIYRISKQREKERRDVMGMKVVKSKDGTILVEGEKVKERWKEYFEELLNVENDRGELEKVEAVEGPELDVTKEEVEKAIASMKCGKASGPSGVNVDMIKALGELGIEWVCKILNIFFFFFFFLIKQYLLWFTVKVHI